MFKRQKYMRKSFELLNSLFFNSKRILLPFAISPSPEKSISYRIGKYNIQLPPGHKLPEYEKLYPQLDRFLPHLAACMTPGSIIIDVGANCADTVAAMADRNPELKFLCVEGDKDFFEYLTSNIEKILNISPRVKIISVNTLAGKNINGVILTGANGSKSAALPAAESSNSDILASKTLDDIAVDSGISLDKVSLIKVDTDGYDYDVLASAEQIISRSNPLLFFECQFLDETQKCEFKSLFQVLDRHGYKSWAVFDNFGALVMRVSSIDEILQLIDYIWLQNLGKSARTIYYLDILAATQASEANINAILDSYINI